MREIVGLEPAPRLIAMAPDAGVRKWQDWLTPAFKRISGGCHLNRPIRTMIESAGFRFDRLETAYMPGPKPMSFIYEGSARLKAWLRRQRGSAVALSGHTNPGFLALFLF